jgi:arylsulfatase A-like enzyme
MRSSIIPLPFALLLTGCGLLDGLFGPDLPNPFEGQAALELTLRCEPGAAAEASALLERRLDLLGLRYTLEGHEELQLSIQGVRADSAEVLGELLLASPELGFHAVLEDQASLSPRQADPEGAFLDAIPSPDGRPDMAFDVEAMQALLAESDEGRPPVLGARIVTRFDDREVWAAPAGADWSPWLETLPLPEGSAVVTECWRDPEETLCAPLLVEAPAPVTAAQVARSEMAFDEQFFEPHLELSFDEAGAQAFHALSERLVGRYLAIVSEGRVLSRPRVAEPIPGGRAWLNVGAASQEDLQDLWRFHVLLSTGPFPEGCQDSTQAASPSHDRPPDILLVVMDTVRAQALSAYGAEHPTSPHFDALAQQGALFLDTNSVGTWTWSSHASLFTGEPPWIHGAHFSNAGADPASMQLGEAPLHVYRMREDLPTLAGQLSEGGYTALALSTNPYLDEAFGLTRGFRHTWLFSEDSDTVSGVQQVLEQAKDGPLFVFVNLFGAHGPMDIHPVPWLADRPELVNPPAWLAPMFCEDGSCINLYNPIEPEGSASIFEIMRGDHPLPPEAPGLLTDVYHGEVWQVDRDLGRVLELWRQHRGDQTVVAVTSDHGELLGERCLMDHGRLTEPELVRVPLLLTGPGIPTRRVTTPVQSHELHHALLALAGRTPSAWLLDAIAGAERSEPILSAAWPDPYWALELGAEFAQGYRYYRSGDEAVRFGTDHGLQYLRIRERWPEPADLEAHRARAEALREEASAHFVEQGSRTRAEFDAQTTERLRELGYVE